MPGELMTFKERKEYSDAFLKVVEKRMSDLTDRMLSGTIDLGEWQRRMQAELREAYKMMVAIGAGGNKSDVLADDWLKLGPELKSQYKYLERFAREIATGNTRNIKGRVAMYARSSQKMFWEQSVPVKLPVMPKEGTQCLSNCNCEWAIEYERNRRGRIVAVLATWKLNPGENCPDCIQRAALYNPLRVPVARSFEPDPAFKEVA